MPLVRSTRCRTIDLDNHMERARRELSELERMEAEETARRQAEVRCWYEQKWEKFEPTLERFLKLTEFALHLGLPVGHIDAIGHIDKSHPIGRRLGQSGIASPTGQRSHGFEPRQCQGGPDATKHGSAGEQKLVIHTLPCTEWFS